MPSTGLRALSPRTRKEKQMTDRQWPVPEEKIAAVLQALKKNEFLAYYFPEAGEARDLVLGSVGQGTRVGLGGSETLRQIGMPVALKAAGAVTLDHWDRSLSADEDLRCRRDQLQ